MGEFKQIGWYHLKEETEFHNAGFETAAWFEDILVPAGKYPVEIYNHKVYDDGCLAASSAYVRLSGTIVRDYFPALFFGNVVSDYDMTKNAGKETSYTMSPYLFRVARSVVEDKNSPYELFPEYRAETKRVKAYDGSMITVGDIYLKEGKEN